jgi:Domain of unknown function (DUF4157)
MVSPKKEPQHQDGLAAKQRSPRPEVKNSEPSVPQTQHHAAVIRRASLDPNSLTPRDVLQLQRAVGNRAVGKLLGQTARRQLPPRRENLTGLPDNLKAGVESLSSMSLDEVRVHYNSSKPAALQALAYTQGTDIYVGPGQESHLPHEAWHVVQQKQGRVQPTIQAKEVSINDDGRLEHEADLMGAKALQTGCCRRDATASASQPSQTVQRLEATADSARKSPAGRGVVQLSSTTLHFVSNLSGNSKITATQHTRSAVHAPAVNWVFDNGAWKSVPDNTVCNHSKDYDTIAQDILDDIHDEKLTDAATSVTNIHTTLKNNNQGIGAPTSTHKDVMDDLINHPGNAASLDDVVNAFNYYIYKIGDYPRNLFFWPDKTDGNPDQPSGEYGENNAPHTDWKVNNGLIGNKTRLSREKKRLKDARDDLTDALP